MALAPFLLEACSVSQTVDASSRPSTNAAQSMGDEGSASQSASQSPLSLSSSPFVWSGICNGADQVSAAVGAQYEIWLADHDDDLCIYVPPGQEDSAIPELTDRYVRVGVFDSSARKDDSYAPLAELAPDAFSVSIDGEQSVCKVNVPGMKSDSSASEMVMIVEAGAYGSSSGEVCSTAIATARLYLTEPTLHPGD